MPSALAPIIDTLAGLAGDVALTSVARGDVLYRGASKWNNLAAGTSGKVLTSGGAGVDPSWATPTPGITDHGALTGLGDDDHTQYHTDARGDARYSLLGHNHDAVYSALGHTHTFASLTSKPTTLSGYGIADAQGLDATLTALAAYNTNGLLTQTAADTFTGRTITGTADKVTVTNGDGVSGNPTLTIASTYVGQTSITTLGTIATGVWTGTTIALANGGTGATTQAGAANAVLPSQTSNSGKYLTTDGSNASWGTVTVPAAANPSASVGLSAVNGSASTFMRSDGAPALSPVLASLFSKIQLQGLG